VIIIDVMMMTMMNSMSYITVFLLVYLV